MPLNEWNYENICKWYRESRRNYTIITLTTTKILKRCVFVLVTWPWRLLEEWPEACGSLTVVGAGTMHVFCTYPTRNPTIWLVETRNQVNSFACRGRIRYITLGNMQCLTLYCYTEQTICTRFDAHCVPVFILSTFFPVSLYCSVFLQWHLVTRKSTFRMFDGIYAIEYSYPFNTPPITSEKYTLTSE